MAVKIDPVVLDAVATRTSALGEDVQRLLAEARTLDAGWAVSGLSGIAPWADETSTDLRQRLDIVQTIENSAVGGFGELSMLRIAGGREPIAVSFGGIRALETQPDANAAWEMRPDETLDDWITRLKGQAIDELSGLEGFGRPVAEFFHWYAGYASALVAAGRSAIAATTIAKVSATRGLLIPAMMRLNLSDRRIKWAMSRYGTYRAPGTTMQSLLMRMMPVGRFQSIPQWAQRMAANSGLRSLLPAIETRLPTLGTNIYEGIFGSKEYQFINKFDEAGERLVASRGASNLFAVAGDAPSGARFATVARTAGAFRGLGIVGQAGSAVMSTAQVVSHGNPVEAFKRDGAGYVADVAKAGLDISLTAAMIAPSPITWGAVAVTGAVYAGAEIVDHWDDITAATEKAADWVGNQLADIDDVGDVVDKVGSAVDKVGSAVDKVADSKINPMNWF